MLLRDARANRLSRLPCHNSDYREAVTWPKVGFCPRSILLLGKLFEVDEMYGPPRECKGKVSNEEESA